MNVVGAVPVSSIIRAPGSENVGRARGLDDLDTAGGAEDVLVGVGAWGECVPGDEGWVRDVRCGGGGGG
jgi:hypothetical protein